jgi:hypothetical protein
LAVFYNYNFEIGIKARLRAKGERIKGYRVYGVRCKGKAKGKTAYGERQRAEGKETQ